jgi:hypothetical protein
MKALNLILSLLLCTCAYGQDFDDLKVINSEKAFKRFCFENEFVQVEKNDIRIQSSVCSKVDEPF